MGSFTKREQIVILLIVSMIIILFGFKFLVKDLLAPKNPTLGLVTQGNIEPNKDLYNEDVIVEETYNPLIMVHISGQVINPGIIELVLGDRVIDAVNLAGGLTKNADLDRINLAKKVSDEEKIYVPKIGEEVSVEISNEPIPIPNTQTSSDNQGNRLNINLCSSNELESLPGIGEVIAGRIIEYRSSRPFKSIDELKNVSGIGDKKFEGIKDLIIVK